MKKHIDVNEDDLTYAEMRAALKHAREIAESERRARARAEESAQRAWRLATWVRPTGLASK